MSHHKIKNIPGIHMCTERNWCHQVLTVPCIEDTESNNNKFHLNNVKYQPFNTLQIERHVRANYPELLQTVWFIRQNRTTAMRRGTIKTADQQASARVVTLTGIHDYHSKKMTMTIVSKLFQTLVYRNPTISVKTTYFLGFISSFSALPWTKFIN